MPPVQNSDQRVRPMSAAGRFYSSSSRQLTDDVERYIAEAISVDLSLPHALIAPHAGYVCSAVVAASAFQTLHTLPSNDYTVYLMGPAHWMPVGGVGLSSANGFETPLGTVPVATDVVQRLVDTGDLFRIADDAHAPEHGLEVELPFLRTTLADCRIVPMLFDDGADPNLVADILTPIVKVDTHSLIIVSSDLSHYKTYEQATKLDRELLVAIETENREAASHGQACGLLPILTLMAIADRLGWTPHVTDYRNSGDTCGPCDEVVGYGAVVYV